MCSRSSVLALVAACATIVCTASVAPDNSPGSNASVTCTAESPVDGSFWIGTSGDGLFRLGRNGKILRYTESSGHLGADQVLWLGFDNHKLLWILDSSGVIRTYSSVNGFTEVQGLPQGIVAAEGTNDREIIVFATQTELFSVKPVDGSFEKVAELSLIPESILLSDSGKEVWLFGENGVQKCSLDGAFFEWDLQVGASNLLPFKYETNELSGPPRGGFRLPFWALIVLLIAAFFLGRYLSRMASSAAPYSEATDASSEINNKVSSTEPIVVRMPQTAPAFEVSDKSSSSITLDKPVKPSSAGAEFSKKVHSLIKDNISDPDFDVDKLAELTGLSRIHVNRKLKTEGASSPSLLIKEARMSMASKLLKQGKLSISQIAAECGFRTPSYFATAFKEYYGISPTDFVEINQG